MLKNHLYCIFAVYLLNIFAFSSVQARDLCINAFSTPVDRATAELNSLIALDEQIAHFEQTLGALSNDALIAQRLEDVRLNYREAEGLLGQNSNSLEPRIRSLSEQLKELETFAMTLNQRANTDFEFLMNHSLLLRPGLLYQIKGMDHSVQRVSFSEDVLRGIFWSETPLMQRVVQLVHRALLRGRINATDNSGIFPFPGDKSVFKVKIYGQNVGAIRLGGFFIGSDFHIVTWSQDSTHGVHASQRIFEQVNRIRDTFLRTNHY
jgi:hypothetical protein